MKQFNFKKRLVKPLTLFALCLTTFSQAATAGGDTYEIYLNKKLMLKQYVGQLSQGIFSLQLDKSNVNDNLIIYYSHCGVAGKGRNIVVKNDRGDVLKEWEYADASGKDVSMSIPVKDILELKRNNANAKLKLFYFSSKELPKGLVLAAISLENKSTTQREGGGHYWAVFFAGILGLAALTPLVRTKQF